MLFSEVGHRPDELLTNRKLKLLLSARQTFDGKTNLPLPWEKNARDGTIGLQGLLPGQIVLPTHLRKRLSLSRRASADGCNGVLYGLRGGFSLVPDPIRSYEAASIDPSLHGRPTGRKAPERS
jgi:hypothetical protein